MFAGAFSIAVLSPSAPHAQNGVAPEVKRMALIIANQDYDQDGVLRTGPADQPAPGYLKDLKNPCQDAALFRDKLIAAHWQPEEIAFTKCDMTADEMRTAISAFREKVANAVNTLAILYYSGHGAQFADSETSHGYLFGVGAHVDLDRAAASLKTSPGNTSFIATQAVDLHELLSTLGRQTDNGVLVIIDACRNNPLYGQINAYGGNVAAISANLDEFTGIVIAYATPSGEFAEDGAQDHSIYTSAFSNLLAPQRNLDSLINHLRTDVVAAYHRAYPARRSIQEPVARGRFTGDWCVWACPPQADTHPVTPQAHAANVSMRAPAIRYFVQPPDVAAEPFRPAPPSPVRQVYAAPSGGDALGDEALRMRFDVFWCDGDADADVHKAQADAIGDQLAAVARWRAAGEMEAGGPPKGLIASVRVRRLSAAANTSTGFRYHDNLVAYDEGDASELAWSKLAASAAGGQLQLHPESARTPGYVSLFVCKTLAPQTATQAYLQVPSATLKSPGRDLLRYLETHVARFSAVKGIQVLSTGPSQTELRYYHPEDRDTVFAAADALEAVVKHPVRIQFMPHLAGPSTVGHMEIWLGKDAPEAKSGGPPLTLPGA